MFSSNLNSPFYLNTFAGRLLCNAPLVVAGSMLGVLFAAIGPMFCATFGVAFACFVAWSCSA